MKLRMKLVSASHVFVRKYTNLDVKIERSMAIEL